MYYTKKCPECGQKAHVHVRADQKVLLKNVCKCLEQIKQPLYLKQTEKLFKARFRYIKNSYGNKIRLMW